MSGPLTRQDDARKIVSWNKYPPKGTRGFGPMFSAHSFNLTEPQYPAGADDNLLVIVQIESRQGVENVEEIAAVDGIDVLFIGESGSHLPVGYEPGHDPWHRQTGSHPS